MQPDVLLVDEVLSVGDESFQRRSGARMQELIAAGTAVVLVSHNLATVRDEAQRVVWLENCRVRMSGGPAEVVDAYMASIEPTAA